MRQEIRKAIDAIEDAKIRMTLCKDELDRVVNVFADDETIAKAAKAYINEKNAVARAKERLLLRQQALTRD